MTATKIATCCYCGKRTTLVLRGKDRHELTCGSCGAPLHAMKMLPIEPGRATASVAAPAHPKPGKQRKRRPEREVPRPRKRRKTRSFGRKVLSELLDVIEDVFD